MYVFFLLLSRIWSQKQCILNDFEDEDATSGMFSL